MTKIVYNRASFSAAIILLTVVVLLILILNREVQPDTVHSITEIHVPEGVLTDKQDGAIVVAEIHEPEGVLTDTQDGAVVHGVMEPMVLSLGYWEQTANALKNLIDLQCWTKSVNISKVVEPSITAGLSAFGFTNKQSLKLGDLYSISEWNEMSVGRGFSSLESLEHFFKYAVKEVVYAHIKYDGGKCQKMADVTRQEWHPSLKSEGFKVIKVVCIDFASHVMSDSSFRDSIFQGISHSVTVVFNDWRGIRSSERVALKGSKCINCLRSLLRVELASIQSTEISYIPVDSISPLVPSQKIDDYVFQFLSKQLSGGEYIAVMLRSEKIKKQELIKFDKSSCANGIISDWKEIVQDKNIMKTLFFSDIGRYGRPGWHNTAAREFSQHIHDALHLHLALDEMNSILENLTGSRDFVQMAVLHQQLVARATCVLVIGGGNFQQHTLNTYAHLHRGKECYVHRDEDCDENYISHVCGKRKP